MTELDSEEEYLSALGPDIEAVNRHLSSSERLRALGDLPASVRARSAWQGSQAQKTLFKAKKTDWIQKLIWLDGKPFDLRGRPYLDAIYNSNYKRRLLLCGRQTEKCQRAASHITLASGEDKVLRDVVTGDYVIGVDDSGHQYVDTVLASESNGFKRCLKITTRTGRELIVTPNHPLKKFFEWVNAEDLKVGDRIASLRTAGIFGGVNQPLAGLIGLIYGDGSFSSDGTAYQKRIGFVVASLETKQWFIELVVKMGREPPNFYAKQGTTAESTSLGLKTPLGLWVTKHNLWGSYSHTKVLPSEVFSYDRESTRELLRGLWATDGHCKNIGSRVDLVYCTTSKTLSRQIQNLLRKFGIQTTEREYQPKLKNAKLAYILRVVTRKSVEAFYQELGPIPGKPFELSTAEPNSNLDTLPKDIYDITKRVMEEKHITVRWLEKEHGFRLKYEYAPTLEKVAKCAEIFEEPLLKQALTTDLFWDEIVSIEDAGEHETWAIQTKTQTYVSDFIIQHNSSLIVNELIINSVVIPFYKTLLVTPSHDQSRQISNGKLKPWIDGSPLIKKYWVSSSCSQHVFERTFTNSSVNFIRSAFLTADRTRGISADALFLDEIQSLMSHNIPIIQECMSHSVDPIEVMSGTPLTLENTAALYWDLSSQCEWLVPCDRHTPRHWNFLDEKCIGLKGPICNKCGKPINPAEGKWIAFNSSRDVMGFRISQVMVPWMYQHEAKWKQLVWKKDNYSTTQFKNECLGISYDSASKPITRAELVACCSTKWPFRYRPDNDTRCWDIFAGVDWGEGTDGTERGEKGRVKSASYTILTLGTYIAPGKFHIFFYKRYDGAEAAPSACVADISATLRSFNFKCAGVDYGFGWGVNEQLEELFGAQRIIKYQHVGMQKERKKYDEIGRKYQLNRTEVMSDFFADVKKQVFIWPEWESVKHFLCDIEHVFAEYNPQRGAIQYSHKSTEPDDVLHSSLICREAADNYFGITR